MSIQDGLTTGPQPSVDQMLADKVERTRSRHEGLDDPLDGLTAAEQHDVLARSMLAPEGIPAGLEEVRDLDLGEQLYEQFVNSPEALAAQAREQGLQDALDFKREHDRWMQVVYPMEAALNGNMEFESEYQMEQTLGVMWAQLTPDERVQLASNPELNVDDSYVVYLDALANHHLRTEEAQRTQAQANMHLIASAAHMTHVADEYQLDADERAKVFALAAQGVDEARGRGAFDALPPQVKGEVVRLTVLDLAERERAEQIAQMKRDLFSEPTTNVQDGLQRQGADGSWHSVQPVPEIVARPDFNRVLAMAEARTRQESDAEIKASVLADDAMTADYKRVQRIGIEIRGEKLRAEQERERALRGQVVGTRGFVPRHAR